MQGDWLLWGRFLRQGHKSRRRLAGYYGPMSGYGVLRKNQTMFHSVIYMFNWTQRTWVSDLHNLLVHEISPKIWCYAGARILSKSCWTSVSCGQSLLDFQAVSIQ